MSEKLRIDDNRAAESPDTSEELDADDRLDHFRPLQQRKAADVVADILVDAIRNGLYHPGDRLPRERDLAGRLEVSRTTLREAISILKRAGVVKVRRGNQGGVFVATRVIPSTLLESVDGLDRHTELRSLLEVRRPLELLAGVLAARRASEETFQEIAELNEQLAPHAGEPFEFMHIDFQIHLRIAEASQNTMLVSYLSDILKKQLAIRFEYPVETFSPTRAMALHREMLRALVERNELSVIAIVDEHLANVERHMLGERLPASELHKVSIPML
jgi:GntR family transcriptional repressor for pyruvate dehydrogenase complex